MVRGRLYDGQQSIPRDVMLEISTLDLRLRSLDGNNLITTWAWADVSVLSPPGDGLRGTLSHKVDVDTRLVIGDENWASDIAPHLKEEKRIPKLPLVLALCVASLTFAAALILSSPFVLDIAAQHVPFAWEDTLGSYASSEMTGDKVCSGNPRAQKALNRMAQALDADGQVFNVSVANLPYINAISLPGRRIVIFKGLLDNATAPEQLAGVMAHEVGHHHYHHPIRIFMQNTGGQILLNLALGNAAVMSQAAGAAREVLLLKGSREFEQQADAYAVTALARNKLDTSSLISFLDILAKKVPEGDSGPEFLNSHPVTASRIESLKQQIAALGKPGPFKQGFSPAEWKDIRAVCLH